MKSALTRTHVAMTAMLLVVAACTTPADSEAVHDGWCERFEAWGIALGGVAPRVEEDPASITEEEIRHLDEVMEDFAAAPAPEPIEEEWAVLRGDVDFSEDPLLAEEEFFEAVRVISAYAEDECGIELDEDPFG